MRRYRFVQYDVFTETPFVGNPLAVFPDAEGLSDAEMQAIAREMNVSETTFVLPATDARAAYRVRIFTPSNELPYAGHPSIGTALHMAREGLIPLEGARTRFHQDVKAGVLPMDVDVVDGRAALAFTTQAPPVFEPPLHDRAAIAAVLGLDAADLVPTLPVQVVSTGVRWVMVPVRDLEAVARIRASSAALERVRDAVRTIHVYAFALGARDPAAATHSRGFLVGEFEDPVTGSASGCLGAYLAKHRLLPARDGRLVFENEQGLEMGRPGRARVEVDVDAAGDPREVRVGGGAVRVVEGAVELP